MLSLNFNLFFIFVCFLLKKILVFLFYNSFGLNVFIPFFMLSSLFQLCVYLHACVNICVLLTVCVTRSVCVLLRICVCL